MLPQVLAELNLQPGQCQRIRVNGYELEIRRLDQKQSDFSAMVMLEPWLEFPPPRSVATVPTQAGKLPLPDAPDIPPQEEGV